MNNKLNDDGKRTRAEYMKEYRRTHRKERAEYMKEYRKTHKEQISESNRKYREKQKALQCSTDETRCNADATKESR